MRRPKIEKVTFFLSAVLLALLWGYGARAFGHFPHRLLDRAMRQAASAFSPPTFVSARPYDRVGARALESGAVQPGLTLVAGVWGEHDWASALRLIDAEGRVHHEWVVDPAALFADSVNRKGGGTERAAIHGSRLLPNGDVVFNFNYVGTVRADACGRVLWSLPAGSHHSVERADDGSFWIPGSSLRGPVATEHRPGGFPGIEGPVYHDELLRVATDGEVLRRINVLELLYENELERYLAKYFNTRREDVTHLNDVEPLPDSMASGYPSFDAGDLLLSLLHLDLVLVVDPDDRRVKWHASDPFIRQHDPDFIGGGWIGVFDNNRDYTPGGGMLGGSRIVAIQPHTDSVEILYPTSRSGPFYTEMMGKWQRLPNGNRLLTESRAGRVVEVAPDGRPVWEWLIEPFDAERVPDVSEGTRYDLTPADVAEWPCAAGSRTGS